jgi:exonuclease SbcC
MFFKQLFEKVRPRREQDPADVIEIARSAPEATARREACRALVQLDVLWQIANEDEDPSVRDLAFARHRRLLCGQDEQAPTLSERSAALTAIGDKLVIAQVARQAVEPELRRTAIEQVTDPEQLAACAVEDGLSANRKAAAERIQDRAALEKVLRRIGKRDKAVYKLVKDRLKTMNEAEERPRRLRATADSVCERLERLGRFENWTQDHALLQLLDKEWAEVEEGLGGALDQSRRGRHEKLRNRFLEGYNAYAAEHAAQIEAEQAAAAAAEHREGLITTLLGHARLDDLDALSARIEEAERDWAAAEPDDAPNAVNRRYRDALSAARERLDHLQAVRRRERAAAALRKDAEQALQVGELDQRRVRGLEQRLEKLSAEGGVPTASTEAVKAVSARFKKHREQVRRKLQSLPERLAELDRHFDDGQLKQAEPLYQSIRATLAQAKSAGLPAEERADAERHLKQIEPQLKELQRWRRWGADTRRQTLCEQIEQLAADTEHELEPLANRLSELTDDWRGLDRNGAPADDALWQRFRTAADRIRERCRPFFDAQAKIRSANREQRQALCEQLEAFLDQVDWERMDWKKAMRAEREMRRAWAALDTDGDAGGRQRRGQRPLEGRFRKSLRRLDEALESERERNLAERRELIGRMQQLCDEPDLRRAIDAAKELQRGWKPTVTGKQREENALWQEFRAAADAVFARREAEFQARNAEQDENLTTRLAVCTALAEATTAAEDEQALRRALRAQQKRWQDLEALPVPKAKLQSLRNRWREVEEAAEARVEALAAGARWSALEAIAARARWCDVTAAALASPSKSSDDGPADQTEASPETAAAEATSGAQGAVPTAEGLRAEWAALSAAPPPLAAKLDASADAVIAAAAADAAGLEQLRAQMEARR